MVTQRFYLRSRDDNLRISGGRERTSHLFLFAYAIHARPTTLLSAWHDVQPRGKERIRVCLLVFRSYVRRYEFRAFATMPIRWEFLSVCTMNDSNASE